MRHLQRILLMLLLCLPATMPAIAAVDDADAMAIATRLLDHMEAGEYEAATADFSPQMKAALDVGKLAAVQEQVAAAGAEKSRDAPKVSEQPGMTVVVIRIHREQASIDATIAVDGEGKVAGLRYAPAAAPAAEAPAVDPEAGYEERDFAVGSGERALPGTLAMPNGAGAGVPAVVLVHGSGPQDRDETVGPNRPFLDIARGLAAQGIAVLRYDKRSKARPQDYADGKVTIDSETTDDAVAAVAALRKAPGIDPARVFVLGHSQGAMMAPRIAAQSGHVAGLVLLAAPARPLLDILIEQNIRLAVLDDAKTSDAEAAAIAKLKGQVAAVRAGGDVADADSPMQQPVAYWRSIEAVDPVSEAKAVALPMLVLQGAQDIQVVDADWQRWKGGFHDDPKVEFKLYPTLNHFGIAVEGEQGLAQYQQPGHVDPALIADVAKWIQAHGAE
ncbi:alpha/beta fold hydrolase [Luteimonas sp. 22616]|uniref:alpha/beta hydrolase n=1 Tax=Luteimonas sp. 22616 TaxID=3453951 RepID=UPI003F84638B